LVTLEQLEDEWSEAYHEILDVLYEEATPGLDYNGLEPGELVDEQPPTYLRHYLDADRQEELIEGVLDDYSIPEDLYFEAKKAVLLSSGPSASLNRVDSARTKHGLQPVSKMLRGEM
jgi:hypothetical protein